MRRVTLDDKYLATCGSVYVTGPQALVRIAIDQARADARAGLNTAGFISGYRGSPLGTFDHALWQAEAVLRDNGVAFTPGINEDLAATAVWGTQQAAILGTSRHDGIFAMWYGKGPGVDRSADVLKHGNFAGTSRHGGVLVLCGDDHAARSSTVAHQSDHALIHCGIPVLNPASLQEYLDYGLLGYALSRYSASWIGFKCVTDTVDGSATIRVDADRLNLIEPQDFSPPPGGLWIRQEVAALSQESRLFEYRLDAVRAFARANRLDRQTSGADGHKQLGIVTTGKTYRDVTEAFAALGLVSADLGRLGIGIYKVGLVWPLEPSGIRDFAANCDEILVLEEKRGLIEEQLTHILYNLPADCRPRIIGKRDLSGRPFVSEIGELSPAAVLRAVAARHEAFGTETELGERLQRILSPTGPAADAGPMVVRPAAFCAGCPHNTSTRVPEGSTAVAGIGCHGMASLMPERRTLAGQQMGGEGAQWIGQAPFVETPHIFQNLGDGTYFHSGLLAIRACVAAGVNITYKILLNGVVGMTGGQPIEGEEPRGEVSGPHVAYQAFAEGVARIAIVADDPNRLVRDRYPAGTTFHQRDDLDSVQRELRDWKGVSLLIYDQACATERRRMRKRGAVPQATERLLIASQVCEGCGDCGLQSNCIAIEPLETEFGRKRRINQSVCNQDYSCLKGFCPSFVTITGGKPRARSGRKDEIAARVAQLSEPQVPEIGSGKSVLVTGIGGSGIVTVGAILGMAAHIEGKDCTVLDMSGFAQRNGSVMSHVRFSGPETLERTARIPVDGADVVIGADPIVTAGNDCIAMMKSGEAHVILNTFVAPTNAFAIDPNFKVDAEILRNRIARRIGRDHIASLDATGLATALLGDAIGANMFLVGHAWQLGLLPLSRESISEAIRLNGTAVAMNLAAFGLGRLAAAEASYLDAMRGEGAIRANDPEDLDGLVASRAAHLEAYQNAALADRYRALVARVASAEAALPGERGGLALTVARVYARLLAYKDEYEVARLFSSEAFRRELDEAFEGDFRIAFNLAPPLLSRRDPATGRLRKRSFGQWVMPAFRLLAGLRGLRGTALDPFGYHPHRRRERQLVRDYEALVEEILQRLTDANHGEAVKLAAIYGTIRGYDVVKDAAMEEAQASLADARAAFSAASTA